MSHYTKMSIQAQQKFEAEFLAALKEHFGQDGVEVHKEKADLKTYMKVPSGRKAEIIVRQETLSKKAGRYLAVNDLGYERNRAGGYDVHVDLDGFPAEHQNLIAQDYAERVAKKQLKAKGYTINSQRLPTGEIRLVAQRF